MSGMQKIEPGIRKVEGVFRPEVFSKVIEELEKIGYPGITAYEVRGHGKQKGLKQVWRGAAYKRSFLPKIKCEVVVLEEDVSRVVRAMIAASRTGKEGDGKIFVSGVEEAIRVRTGESGYNAI
jgi:nitrogen regulatory protein P-II 1